MGKTTISMVIFNSFLLNYQRVTSNNHPPKNLRDHPIIPWPMMRGPWAMVFFVCLRLGQKTSGKKAENLGKMGGRSVNINIMS